MADNLIFLIKICHEIRQMQKFCKTSRYNMFSFSNIEEQMTLAKAVTTQQKSHNLFRVDENSIELCFAAHIVQCCQQYCSALLHLIAG